LESQAVDRKDEINISVDEAKRQFEQRCPAFMEDPEPALQRLLADAPVYFSEAMGGWVVSRYKDVTAVLRDQRHFSNVGTMNAHVHICAEAEDVLGPHRAKLMNFLANTDGAQHDRLRAAIARGLSQKAVARVEEEARAVASSLATGLAEHLGEPKAVADLGRDYGEKFPVQVIGGLIGLPAESQQQVSDWVADWFNLYRFTLSEEEQVHCARSAVAYDEFVSELVEHYEQHRAENLICEVLDGIAAGEFELSRAEVVDAIANLIVGGIHTTAAMLSAVMLRFLSTGDVWAQLVACPEQIGPAIEEAMRLEGVAFAMNRVVAKEVSVGCENFEVGQRVYLNNRASDLDGEVFPDPCAYRGDRENARRNLNFGLGTHVCIGAPLARMELRVAVEELAARVPELRLAPSNERRYLPSPSHRRLQHLLVQTSSQ
jgi:cytochrome P450